jgi:hypothetical protein
MGLDGKSRNRFTCYLYQLLIAGFQPKPADTRNR